MTVRKMITPAAVEPVDPTNLLLTTLLNELDSMVYLCRPDRAWALEFVSAGCKALTGYSPRHLLHNQRLSFVDLMHQEDRDQVLEVIRTALDQNQPFSVEYRMLHRDGSERWVWERGRGLAVAPGQPALVHGFVQDISDRHNREKALAEAEQRYRSIFEHATEGIFQSTQDGHYLEVNPALAAIYGYTTPLEMVSELKDIANQLYVIPGRRNEFARQMLEEGRVVNFESQVYRRDGAVIWISENAHEVRNIDGELLYYEGTVEDISERKSYEQQIAYQATHDHLTDLPNRNKLRHHIDIAIKEARRSSSQLMVVFIDLDHFKNVNDSLGHGSGDDLIRIIGSRLRSCVRDTDTVARLGGDEFVILSTETLSDTKRISSFVQRVLDAIEQPCMLSGKEYLITCSVGISQYPVDGEDADTLLKNADMAMYKAKQAGRNNFQFFTNDLNVLMTERLRVQQDLRMALKENQFELHYQPQFAVDSLALVGVEALIRWKRSTDDALVLPGNFIHLAEEMGLIDSLGSWVIDEACRQLRQWLDLGYEVVPLSINLSVRQFQQAGLVSLIKAAIDRHGIDPELLVLELTESCMVLEEQRFIDLLADLKALGLAIAIDDFGTGYCNIMALKTWLFDSLKIDRSFIAGVSSSEKDRAIYSGIVAMAKHLCSSIVAEGVETAEQYEFLKSIGCNKIQGFYLASPQTAVDFSAMLKKAGNSLLICGENSCA
ncbi:MAG: EAL domain-containing protein [Porticoccaceae bacterium]|nr:EAL domain-containing protein [Porticoccaceae bacterium]